MKTKEELMLIPLNELHISRLNTREKPKANSPDIKDLAASIKAQGQLTPLIVRKQKKGGYEIAAGARRFTALKKLKHETARCKVLDLSDDEFLSVLFAENNQQVKPSLVSESLALCAMYGEIKKANPKLTNTQIYAEIGERIGRNKEYVARHARLENLHKDIKAMLLEGIPKEVNDRYTDITISYFRGLSIESLAVVARQNPCHQERFLEWIEDTIDIPPRCANEITMMLEGDPSDMSLNNVPWDLEEDMEVLMPHFGVEELTQAGPCIGCMFNTDDDPTLFDMGPKKKRCTNTACFAAKQRVMAVRKVEELKKDGVTRTTQLHAADIYKLEAVRGEVTAESEDTVPAVVFDMVYVSDIDGTLRVAMPDKVVHVRPYKESSKADKDASKIQQAASVNDKHPTPENEAEVVRMAREVRLRARRNKWLALKIAEHITSTKHPGNMNDIWPGLIAEFGVHTSGAGGYRSTIPKRIEHTPLDYLNHTPPDHIYPTIWAAAKMKAVERITPASAAIAGDVLEEFAEPYSKFFGFDLETGIKVACKAIPPPSTLDEASPCTYIWKPSDK